MRLTPSSRKTTTLSEKASQRLLPFGTALLLCLSACGDDTTTAIADPDPDPEVGADAGVDNTPDATPDAPQAAKAVYTMSNAAEGNAILAFARDQNGGLSLLDTIASGGVGSGGGLGSQDSLIFDPTQKRFFAVNAGDNSISMLALELDGKPTLESNVDSGGVRPISIAVNGDVVYVVNAGDEGTPANIAGFRIVGSELIAIAGSSRPLSEDAPGPGQVTFNAAGDMLVLTEKGTNKILTYTVAGGIATGPIIHPSVGQTPFGFALHEDTMVMSEAFGGMDNLGASSSYTLQKEMSGLSAVASAVPSGQSAPCWVVVAGEFAFITNTASDNLSAYSIAADGGLTLQYSIATGDAPIDAAVSAANDFLYVLNAADDSFSIFGVNTASGALNQQPDFTGLPANAAGVVVGPNAVYTMSNDAGGNEIAAYVRASDGSLSVLDSYSTDGLGRGAGLGSQNALVYDASQSRVFAVNAGDNTISMLARQSNGSLVLEDNIGSGGVAPVSITVHQNVVYVVNAGDDANPGNISGFQIIGTSLAPIANTTRPLSIGNPGPGQIEFTPDGNLLVVTEKGTNRINTYTVDAGVASGPNAHPSAGTTPFGFAMSGGGQLIVSDAFGGMPNMGAASSYSIGTAGSLSPVSNSVQSGQSAPCWVVTAGNYAYVTNTRTDNVTGYKIAADGSLNLEWSAESGSRPIDASVSDDDGFLYVLNAGDNSFSIFGVDTDTGLLMQKTALEGLPETAVGLVAR